jgi:uncharacterized protein (TIGR01777 family)
MRALVTGATGFVGRRLLEKLTSPVILSRDPERAQQQIDRDDISYHGWNADEDIPPAEAFEGVDVVFHLAGESVAKGRWSAAKKKRILDSRVIGTRHLVDGLRALDAPPGVLVSASAVGFYASRGEEVLTEQSSPGDDFLADVCQQWEAESARATESGIRVVNPRISIVLGTTGGALKQMLTPFRFGLGGRLASGRQWMPWIHMDDLVEAMLLMATNPDLRGPVNVAAPGEVTNLEFTKTLGRVLKRPTIFPVPRFMLRLLIGQFAEILVASSRIAPEQLLDVGFPFAYPDLEAALRQLLGREESAAVISRE